MTLHQQLAKLDQLHADSRDHKITWERWNWLKTLIAAYHEEHDWAADEDPDATREMLMECCLLAETLERDYRDAWAEEMKSASQPPPDDLPL